MSLCFSGLDTPCCVQPVTIDVSPAHPLIQLAQVIPWQALADLVLPDRQSRKFASPIASLKAYDHGDAYAERLT